MAVASCTRRNYLMSCSNVYLTLWCLAVKSSAVLNPFPELVSPAERSLLLADLFVVSEGFVKSWIACRQILGLLIHLSGC